METWDSQKACMPIWAGLNATVSLQPQISQMGKFAIWVNWQHSCLICHGRSTNQSGHHDNRVWMNTNPQNSNSYLIWGCRDCFVVYPKNFYEPLITRNCHKCGRISYVAIQSPGIIPDTSRTSPENCRDLLYLAICDWIFRHFKNLLSISLHSQMFKNHLGAIYEYGEWSMEYSWRCVSQSTTNW